MIMNPIKITQLRPKISEFKQRHPKFIKFFSYAAQSELKEGSILEVKVINPEGKETCTNIRLSAEDAALLSEMLSEK